MAIRFSFFNDFKWQFEITANSQFSTLNYKVVGSVALIAPVIAAAMTPLLRSSRRHLGMPPYNCGHLGLRKTSPIAEGYRTKQSGGLFWV